MSRKKERTDHDHRRPEIDLAISLRVRIILNSQWLATSQAFEHQRRASQLPIHLPNPVLTLRYKLTRADSTLVASAPAFSNSRTASEFKHFQQWQKVSGNSFWCVESSEWHYLAWPCAISIVMYSGASAFNWLIKVVFVFLNTNRNGSDQTQSCMFD